MPRIKLSLAALLMRTWLAAQQFDSQSIPQPTDAPRAHADGFGCDRVLIFGSGPAVGWGVTSHEIALPGSLARALSAHTRHGTDVDLVAHMRFNVGNAQKAFRRVAVDRYDVVILVLGANDAVSLTPLHRWRERLTATLTHLEENSPPGTRIFVTGIPPIKSVPGFRSRLGQIAEDHSVLMNQITAELCGSLTRTAYVALSQVGELAQSPFGDGRTYRVWASEIADVVAPRLYQARWGTVADVLDVVGSRE
ncbi:MAG: SGNH/GDSL hydrolase family protein [Lacisediminihabitans sp.]